jgi:NAD(P)-dependent dehydrogenase (short-subunit alcohol dehydrogenase family)
MTGWTAADLPSFAGRTVIVTGANSGLGFVTARELAQAGAKVILACRNTGKGDEAAAGMTGDVEVRKLDLQDLSSVREFADGVNTADVLVNNAGIMAVPFAQTVDGFESQIGTNHLGHFALTNLLLPKITDRVVTVSSLLHLIGFISLKDLNWKSRPYLAWPAYGQSKLANLLFTSELSAASTPRRRR